MNKTILIVDDDEDIRESLRSLITRAGFAVVLAGSAEEARTRMSFQAFDLLLIDVHMPVINGVQFLARMRQNPPKPYPKVLVMTGMELEEEARTKMISVLGVSQVLLKPFEPAALLEAINTQLRPPEKKSYDASIINAFLTGTINAIQGNTGKAPDREAPFVKESAMTYGEFSGVIQFHGKKTRGVVALSFEHRCVEDLARAVFQSTEMEYTDTLLTDFAGELCNQVAGQTQAIFQQGGNRFEISTPTLIQGKDHRIVHKIHAPCLILPFKWGGGRFFTEFVLENIEAAAATKPEEEETKSAVSGSGDVTFL